MKITKLAQEEIYKGESEAQYINRLRKSLSYWQNIYDSKFKNRDKLKKQIYALESELQKIDKTIEMLKSDLNSAQRS